MRLLPAAALSLACVLGGLAAAPLEKPAIPASLPETGAYKYLDRQDGDFVYIVRPDTAPADGTAEVWAIMAVQQPELAGGYRLSYLAIYNQFDCEGMRRRILGTLIYDENDKIVPEDSMTRPWLPIEPGTQGEDLLALVCHPEKDTGETLAGNAAFRADLRARRAADQP